MRHLLANIATYAIGSMLLIGAALFGWLRAAQVTLSDEKTIVAHYAVAQRAEFEWRELGPSSYVRNCSNCHGRNGDGWDQYPGLGRTGSVLEATGGREHLIDLHLYGLASPRWRAPMPPMGHMPDTELAAVINHVVTTFGGVTTGDFEIVTPEEVSARRGQKLTPFDVERRRPMERERASRNGTRGSAPNGGETP